MDTLDFLQRVLPTGGKYCSWGRAQRFYDTINDLAVAVLDRDQRGQDTYFAISSFKDDSSRKQVNVHASRVLTIDVDCGPDKPFPTWKEGLQALGTFVAEAGLPKPLIVRSGYGLHTYWVLDRDLDRDEWTPLARALKDAAKARGFDIDVTKTADAALVLRPVGTHNYKDPTAPKLVRVILDGGDTTVDAMRKALAYYYNASNTPVKPKNNGLLDSLAVKTDMPPAVGSLIAAKCEQVKWASENQDKVAEPLWYAVIGVAAFCEDPEGTAKMWSENHPGYSESETLRKLQHWQEQATGPSTCAKFEAERPIGCKGCPFAGKIGSPARLGVRYQEVDTSATAPDEVVTDIPVPKPFKRTSNGLMATIDDTDVPVCNFDLYPLSYGYDEALGYEVAQFMWERPHVGWLVLTLRLAYLADGSYREFVGAVADQGIMLETKRQTEYFQIMLRAYINELRKVRTVTNLYSTMGWKEDNEVFVLGDDLFRRSANGVVTTETIRLSSRSTRAGSDMYTTKGSFETWKAGTSLLRKGKLNAHQFSIGIGFASILMQFTGLKGTTVSFYGPSGSGKSLAQLMQQSVWGDPEKLHFQSKFTANSLFNRFGTYAHLPMTVDEATQMSDKDVGDYLYWVSQGRDKARLSRTAEERAPREWALFSTLSTNRPITSKLISTGHETDAQLARLLELRVNKSPLFGDGTDFGRKIHRLFTENYGWAGRMFLHRIMEIGEQGLRAMIASALDEFEARYGVKFDGVERYWEIAIVLTELCLRLAHEWGIIDFDPVECVNWVILQLDSMREAVQDNAMDHFDLLAEYINEHLRETLVVTHEAGKTPQPVYELMPKGSIRVRVDGQRVHGSTDLVGGVMLLERSNFRKWFAEKGGNPREFVEQLVTDGADATPRSKKASLAKNTTLSMPQCYVIGINLNHPRMNSILEGLHHAQEDAVFSKLMQSDS